MYYLLHYKRREAALPNHTWVEVTHRARSWVSGYEREGMWFSSVGSRSCKPAPGEKAVKRSSRDPSERTFFQLARGPWGVGPHPNKIKTPSTHIDIGPHLRPGPVDWGRAQESVLNVSPRKKNSNTKMRQQKR